MSNSFEKLLSFLNQLDDELTPYNIEHNREDTILVTVAVSDERWEIEFYADDDVEVEVFYGEGPDVELEGEEALGRLFSKIEDGDNEEELIPLESE